jgi:hypothetical protein
MKVPNDDVRKCEVSAKLSATCGWARRPAQEAHTCLYGYEWSRVVLARAWLIMVAKKLRENNNF